MAEDTGLAALSHVLAIFTGFLGPLIIMLASDDEFAKENASNALNFQIMLIIGYVVALVLSFVIIGLVLVPILILLQVLLPIIAAVKANNGEAWEYPLTPDFV